jgi:hypothetical protein
MRPRIAVCAGSGMFGRRVSVRQQVVHRLLLGECVLPREQPFELWDGRNAMPAVPWRADVQPWSMQSVQLDFLCNRLLLGHFVQPGVAFHVRNQRRSVRRLWPRC